MIPVLIKPDGNGFDELSMFNDRAHFWRQSLHAIIRTCQLTVHSSRGIFYVRGVYGIFRSMGRS